jgi:hypothetical protein
MPRDIFSAHRKTATPLTIAFTCCIMIIELFQIMAK